MMEAGEKIREKALAYLVDVFPDISKSSDIWSAIAYLNCFSEQPRSKMSEKFIQWGTGVLMPDAPPTSRCRGALALDARNDT